MRRAIDHSAMPAAGFVEPWSLHAGGRAALHLSCEEAVPNVRIVRLDTSPIAHCKWPVAVEAQVERRDIALGSWIEVDAGADVREIVFELLLTRNSGERTILRYGDLALLLGQSGGLRLGDAETAPLATEVWHRVRLRPNDAACTVETAAGRLVARLSAAPSAGGGTILFGRGDDDGQPTLNARFARLSLCLDDGGEIAWTIPPRGPLAELPPSSGNGPRLRFRGNPTFAVTSARWDGTTMDPRLAPDHYDAVHLHDDDLGALDWPATHEVAVPDDAGAGIYAFEIETGRGTERIPFFVRARRPSAPLAFLVPTATYLAYADENLPQALYPWVASDRAHVFAQDNGLKSQYDFHSDASGVTLASLRRPKATLRDDYVYPLCGCAHNLPVDLNLLRFCRENGIEYDLLTDHDLDAEGEAALAPYRALMTGSHPEYWSIHMLDALDAFLDGGGSLAYLGGNGFDTAVAFHGDLMELRRGRTPSHRTWDMRPGELHLAMTGEPGGPLRERGRGEHRLTGVGMTLMGFGPSRPFRRTGESRDSRYEWLFEGVPDTFGEDGMVLGGAAGYEVDCTDARLGTPEGTVVLARADGFGEEFIGDAGRWYEGGESEREESRKAEMTIRDHPGGGIVFSASSVAWAGSLPIDAPLNGAGALTRNLLDRISARRDPEGLQDRTRKRSIR